MCSWDHILKLNEHDVTGEFLINWMQANWEMIVEASIPPQHGVYLEHYGIGADCNGNSCRVWYPEAVSNFQAICVPKSKTKVIEVISGQELFEKDEYVFDEFCTIKDNWFEQSPPFDHVKIQTKGTSLPEPCIISLDTISFEARQITR